MIRVIGSALLVAGFLLGSATGSSAATSPHSGQSAPTSVPGLMAQGIRLDPAPLGIDAQYA